MIQGEVIYTDVVDGKIKGSIRMEDTSAKEPKVLFVGIDAEVIKEPESGDEVMAVGIISAGFVKGEKGGYEELSDYTKTSGIFAATFFGLQKKLNEKRKLLDEIQEEVKELECAASECGQLMFESFDDDRNVLGIVDLCNGG